MSKKFLDLDGLSHLWLLIVNKLNGKVNKEFKTGSTSAYKVLSDNNLTDEMVQKIQNAGSDITVPTKTSDLTNDSGYQTADEVNNAIQAVVGAAPDALDTLKELSDALGNDSNFSATVTTELGKKLNTSDLVAITNDEIDTTCV